MQQRQISVEESLAGHRACFFCMASDCEILIETDDREQAESIAELVANEAWRLQDKYSRYQDSAWLSQLNNASGNWFAMDQETAGLLDFVDQIYALSDGLFDPTSGILRRVWKFDGSNQLPEQTAVQKLLPFIGWPQVERTEKQIRLPQGFELDLGGLVKEWAADKALAVVQQAGLDTPLLINLGGDLRVSGPQKTQQPWQVGVRKPGAENADAQVALSQGGIATSGDENRFILHQGKRYGHLLNPFTGWPIEKAPRSVTVAAPTCALAGILSSLALLKGENAKAFLEQQGVLYWMIE